MKTDKKIIAAAEPAKTNAAAGGTGQATQALPSVTKNITKRPDEKSPAEIIFDKMGTGRHNAVYVNRRDDEQLAREFRRLVSDARKAGIPIVAGMDHTFWIADPTDYIDRMTMIDQAERLEGMAREASKAAQGIRSALAAHKPHASSFYYADAKMWW